MTHYVKGKSLYGPWIIPEDDTLDSFLFYAGRVAGSEKQKVNTAWNAERTGADLGLKIGLRDVVKCEMLQHEDLSPLGYAGDMVIHQLGQYPNGDLRLELLPQLRAEFSRELPLDFRSLQDLPWTQSEEGFSVNSPGRFSCALAARLPGRCLISMTLQASGRETGIDRSGHRHYDRIRRCGR